MDPWQIAVVIAFTSAGATVHASVGIGIGLVAGPALVAVDPGFLPGPVIMVTLILTARHLIVDGHHADRGTVQRAYIGVPFGLALGFVVVAVADEATMRIVIGCAIVIAAALLLLGVHVSRSARTDVLGGGAFALSLIAAGIPGPAAAVAFNDLPPTRYRGTMGFVGIPVGIVSLALLTFAGEFGSHELELTAWMIPGIGVGLLAGRYLRPHLDNAWFRTSVLWLALLGGAALVIRGDPALSQSEQDAQSHQVGDVTPGGR